MKDYKGGYVIVDATGVDLNNVAKVGGLYQQIMNAVAVNKAVMLRNVKNGTKTLTPIYSTVDVGNGTVSLNVYGGVLTVESDDDITFTASKTADELDEEIADLGTDVINMKADLATTAENNKVKAVKFTIIFNHSEFGISNIDSIGLIIKKGTLISLVSVGKGNLFEGRYDTENNTWVSRTVTELTPYTPS